MSDRIESGHFLKARLAELKVRAEKYLPGAKYASIYFHEEGRMILVPPELTIISQFGHAIDYASGVFEGGSVVINETTGQPNIILNQPRLERLFDRSLPSRNLQSSINPAEMAQAIHELITANGLDLFRHPDGQTPGYVRAYIRPSIQPASLAGYGISRRPGYPVDVGIAVWAWPDYLPPELAQNGGVAAITGHQRLFPITGKHASNYGAASVEGTLARSLGCDELIYLAPYLIDKSGHLYWQDPNCQGIKLEDGVIADGPGEECLALTADQTTIVYPPMRVNRLGGTVLAYIIEHMAKSLGLVTQEKDITLRDLQNGKYAGLAMVGNAVKVTPMRELNLYSGNSLRDVIELFPSGDVPEMLELLKQRWEGETRGLIQPSHESLLTPVNLP